MEIFKLLSITLGAILANNFIFSQFLGCCPFLGVSKKVDTAVGMGVAVTFVMGLASAVCFVVNRFILIPLDLAYMQTVAFILVIASLDLKGFRRGTVRWKRRVADHILVGADKTHLGPCRLL